MELKESEFPALESASLLAITKSLMQHHQTLFRFQEDDFELVSTSSEQHTRDLQSC